MATAPATHPVALVGVLHYTPLPQTMSVEAYLGVEFTLRYQSSEHVLAASAQVSHEQLAAFDGQRVELECRLKAPSAPRPEEAYPMGIDGRPMARPSSCEVLSIQASPAAVLQRFDDPVTGLQGYRDATGRVVIPARFDLALNFNEHGVAQVADRDGWRLINSQGEHLVKLFIYDNGPDEFAEGRARFVDAGKIGYVDERGRVVAAATWDFGLPFQEGRAAVCTGCSKEFAGEHYRVVGGQWGFIDRDGGMATPLIYDEVEGFENGVARVRGGDQWRLIGLHGEDRNDAGLGR